MADEAVLAKIRAAEKKAEDIVLNAKKDAEEIAIDAKRTSVKLLEESGQKINGAEEARMKEEYEKIQKKRAELVLDAKKLADSLKSKAEKNSPKAEEFLFKKFLDALD